MLTNHQYCVIMAGGLGVRFWPYSRKSHPKQFLDFFGTGRTMLQQTFDRYIKIFSLDHIYICTNEDYIDLIKEQLPEIPQNHVLVEPMRRNTAPCVAWAVLHIRKRDPEANVVFSPSDQLVLNEEKFLDVITKGLDFVANSDTLLTVGIKPTRPETRYGYIQVTDDEKIGDFYRAKSFTEKPELEYAKIFIESGEFYWNSGLFIWNVNTILEAFRRFIPELYEKLVLANQTALSRETELAFVAENYSSCPNLSIDYGIMEKADNVYVLLGDFGWADLGTWDSLYEASPKDVDGNVILESQTLMYNCKNNIVKLPQGKLAVLQDLDGYMVIDQGNVLMICKKEEDKAIRKFVTDAQIKLGDEYM